MYHPHAPHPLTDLGLTLTYFMPRSNFVPYAFIWDKLLESQLMEET